MQHITFAPMGLGSKRDGLIRKRAGSGRRAQPRSYTLSFAVPLPPPPPSPPHVAAVVEDPEEQEQEQSMAPSAVTPACTPFARPSAGTAPRTSAPHASASVRSAGSGSSFQPFFLSGYTPIEGVPEWMPYRTPGAVKPMGIVTATPAASATPSAGFQFQFTPMEGVPERPMTAFKRAKKPAAPAPLPVFVFTPMEGVPEKCLAHAKTPGMERAMAAAAAKRLADAQAAATPQQSPPSQQQQQGQQQAQGSGAQQGSADEDSMRDLIHRVPEGELQLASSLRSTPAGPSMTPGVRSQGVQACGSAGFSFDMGECASCPGAPVEIAAKTVCLILLHARPPRQIQCVARYKVMS